MQGLWNITFRNLGYLTGYADGLANAKDNVNLEYIYHKHGDGYCNSVPVYHTHSGNSSSGGTCYSPVYCGGEQLADYEGDEIVGWYCKVCKKQTARINNKCGVIKSYSISCGKTTSTIESYKCNLNSSTIVEVVVSILW